MTGTHQRLCVCVCMCMHPLPTHTHQSLAVVCSVCHQLRQQRSDSVKCSQQMGATEMSARRNSPRQEKKIPVWQNPFLLLLSSKEKKKFSVEAPGTLAIHHALFLLDHHTNLHAKYKKGKRFWIWRWLYSHRWCLNTHKFSCCRNRWKLEGGKKNKKNLLKKIFSIHLPDHS